MRYYKLFITYYTNDFINTFKLVKIHNKLSEYIDGNKRCQKISFENAKIYKSIVHSFDNNFIDELITFNDRYGDSPFSGYNLGDMMVKAVCQINEMIFKTQEDADSAEIYFTKLFKIYKLTHF